MTPGTLNLTLYKGSTFGPVIVVCKDQNGAPVDLTGWTPLAQVRKQPGSPKVLDLAPTLLDPTGGKVSFGFSDEQTATMPHGNYMWDFLLERPTGEILGPFLSGSFTITPIVTRV